MKPHRNIHQMGGFAHALIHAWDRADSTNRAKLQREFPQYFENEDVEYKIVFTAVATVKTKPGKSFKQVQMALSRDAEITFSLDAYRAKITDVLSMEVMEPGNETT